MRYSTFGRELLAAYLAVNHFRRALEGRQFTLLTDHQPLTYALKTSSDKRSPRKIRQLDFLSVFTTDIRHIKGKQNKVPMPFQVLTFEMSHNTRRITFVALRQL